MTPKRAIMTLLIAASLLTTAAPVLADGHGEKDQCGGRDGATGEHRDCTQLPAGELSCDPPAGTANDLALVVGAADSGTYQLKAVGDADALALNGCFFEIRVDASSIRFNEGYTFGLLAPYGGASDAGSSPCWAAPGTSCTATASFHWWRAQHGVTFDVPFELYVNGVLVDQGEVHYYDPPMFEDVYGGPFVMPSLA